MSKKVFLIAASFIAFTNVALANTCDVLGVHEPGSNIYDGPTWCQKICLKNIIVRGPLSVKNSIIDGLTDVSGPLQANISRFSNILIESNFSHNKVILKNKTIVNGEIRFKGLKGGVYVDATSAVKGRVINASIYHIK